MGKYKPVAERNREVRRDHTAILCRFIKDDIARKLPEQERRSLISVAELLWENFKSGSALPSHPYGMGVTDVQKSIGQKRRRYVYDEFSKSLVEIFEQPRPPQVFPSIMGDTPDYLSPMEPGKLISGRAQRREDMKRHNVREVDPSEKPKMPATPDYVNDWRAGRGMTRSDPNE